MSGVIDPCSFTIIDTIFLEIPSVLASSEIDNESGSIYCLLNMPPGCVGGHFLILIMLSSAMTGYIKFFSQLGDLI